MIIVCLFGLKQNQLPESHLTQNLRGQSCEQHKPNSFSMFGRRQEPVRHCEESFFVVCVNWTFKDVQAAAAIKYKLIFILITNQNRFCFHFTDDEKCEDIFWLLKIISPFTAVMFILSWSSFPFHLFHIYSFWYLYILSLGFVGVSQDCSPVSTHLTQSKSCKYCD